MIFFSKKSTVKEAIIASNISNFSQYFWKFYLFFIINLVYNDQSSGLFFIRNSYATLFALVTTWGISLFSSRIISYTISTKIERILKIHKKLLYLLFIPTLFIVPIVIFLSLLNLIPHIDVLMLRIFFYLLIEGFFFTLMGFFEGIQEFRFSLLFILIKSLIDTVLITSTLIYGRIYDIILLISIVDFILFICILFFFNSKIKSIYKNRGNDPNQKEKTNNINNFSKLTFKLQLKREALPMGSIAILNIVSDNLSRLYVGIFVSQSLLPAYIFARSIVLTISRIGNGFRSGLVPKLTELNSKQKKEKIIRFITKSCLYNEIIMCLGILIIYIFYEPFSYYFFGLNFSKNSTEIVKLTAIILIFFAFYGIFSSYFIAIGKPKYNLLSSLISSFANIITLILLGSYFGLYAAIIGLLISRILGFFAIPIIILLKMREKTILLDILKILMFSIIFFILINFLIR